MVFCFLQQKISYRTWSCIGFLYLHTLLLYNFPCFQMYTVSPGKTHCQIYPAENKHSENERSLVIFTSEASSYVVLAPKAKVSQLHLALQRYTGPARRCCAAAKTQPGHQNENHLVNLQFCCVSQKLNWGNYIVVIQAQNNCPSTQALGFYYQRERIIVPVENSFED